MSKHLAAGLLTGTNSGFGVTSEGHTEADFVLVFNFSEHPNL